MTLDTITSGVDTTLSTKLNDNFTATRIAQVYSSTGFDTSISDPATGTSTASYELDAIASSTIGNADYAIFYITVSGNIRRGSGSAAAGIKIETKEIGGSYSVSLAQTNVIALPDLNTDDGVTSISTLMWVHTLTSGEKSNGFQAQITGHATLSSGEVSATLTNKQVVLQLGVGA